MADQETVVEKPKRVRRSDEERIADMEAKLAELKKKPLKKRGTAIVKFGAHIAKGIAMAKDLELMGGARALDELLRALVQQCEGEELEEAQAKVEALIVEDDETPPV